MSFLSKNVICKVKLGFGLDADENGTVGTISKLNLTLIYGKFQIFEKTLKK